MKRYTCGNGEGMFETKNGHWIEYSEHEKIVNDLKKQLELTAVGCPKGSQLVNVGCKVCGKTEVELSQMTSICSVSICPH
jgi:hypothetical protein